MRPLTRSTAGRPLRWNGTGIHPGAHTVSSRPAMKRPMCRKSATVRSTSSAATADPNIACRSTFIVTDPNGGSRSTTSPVPTQRPQPLTRSSTARATVPVRRSSWRRLNIGFISLRLRFHFSPSLMGIPSPSTGSRRRFIRPFA